MKSTEEKDMKRASSGDRRATPSVEAGVEGGIGWVVFSQPDKHNAMTLAMQTETAEVLETYAAEDRVRVIVLRGAGESAFVSGADISEFGEKRTSGEARSVYDEATSRVARAFSSLEKPVVAMIHGICFGGGLAIALQADLRIAADDARFAIPAARLGVGYGFAGVERLVKTVGPAHAAEILYTARTYDAREAQSVGLVNRVVPKDALEEETRALAGTLRDNAPLTLRAAKHALRQTFLPPIDRDLAGCADRVEACFSSADYREGQRAFLEKRAPRFSGR